MKVLLCLASPITPSHLPDLQVWRCLEKRSYGAEKDINALADLADAAARGVGIAVPVMLNSSGVAIQPSELAEPEFHLVDVHHASLPLLSFRFSFLFPLLTGTIA